MNFSATYVTGIGTPTLTATPHGYGTNSESGWVDLSWNKVSGASGYTIGIYNGQKYEYQFVGNTTSFTTKGKNLWPTDEEIAAGKYALHWDGAGQELPNIPRLGQSDLNYYFRVMPTNAYGQTAGSATAATVSALLPDTTPPSQPATVSVSPADWSSTGTHTITWAGITDQPGNASTLGTGHVQYVVNPAETDAAAWAWQNTAYNTANGSFTLDTSAFADGSHAVYVRGTDSAGNYGAQGRTAVCGQNAAHRARRVHFAGRMDKGRQRQPHMDRHFGYQRSAAGGICHRRRGVSHDESRG